MIEVLIFNLWPLPLACSLLGKCHLLFRTKRKIPKSLEIAFLTGFMPRSFENPNWKDFNFFFSIFPGKIEKTGSKLQTWRIRSSKNFSRNFSDLEKIKIVKLVKPIKPLTQNPWRNTTEILRIWVCKKAFAVFKSFVIQIFSLSHQSRGRILTKQNVGLKTDIGYEKCSSNPCPATTDVFWAVFGFVESELCSTRGLYSFM